MKDFSIIDKQTEINCFGIQHARGNVPKCMFSTFKVLQADVFTVATVYNQKF